MKELAIEEYKDRFVMINVTLQHVAFTEMKKILEKLKLKENKDTTSPTGQTKLQTVSPILNIGDVDGYMAM